jgi:hypothetical protein
MGTISQAPKSLQFPEANQTADTKRINNAHGTVALGTEGTRQF